MTLFTEGRLQAYERMMQQTYSGRYHCGCESSAGMTYTKNISNENRSGQEVKGGEGDGRNKG